MTGAVNKVILLGNVGRDPEIRSFSSGGRIAQFTLATSERWRDKTSGEQKEKTEWHNIVVKNDQLIDIAERFVRKGTSLYLEGALQTRKWTGQDGQDKYTTEIVLGPYKSTLLLLDSKADRETRDSGTAPAAQRSMGLPANKGRKTYDHNDIDDDLPF